MGRATSAAVPWALSDVDELLKLSDVDPGEGVAERDPSLSYHLTHPPLDIS
eukprot:gene35979-34992_t